MITHRIVDVGHLQEIFGAAVLLHLYGLSAPLHRHTVTLRKLCIGRHLKVSAFEDDFIDVVFVLSVRAVKKSSLDTCTLYSECLYQKSNSTGIYLPAAGDYKSDDDN